MSGIEKEKILEAYEDVRDDKSETTWLVCKYEGNSIALDSKGENYDDLLDKLGDEDRAFAFARVIMGDELSKRPKFVLINWTGTNVSGFKKAKMGPDKQKVKSVIASFAIEVNADTREEVGMDTVKTLLQKAGGANYGTGVRD